MQPPSPNKRSRKPYSLPSPQKVERAIEYFWSLSLETAKFVIIFKLHNLSKRKLRLLLEACIDVTNLIATILQKWREDVAKPRTDGAIAAIFAVQQKGVFGRFRARAFSAIIEKQFAPDVADAKQHLDERLISGACRDTAQMIVSWGERIADKLLEGEPKETILDVDLLRAGWVKLVDMYQRASELIISLAYNPDHPPKEKNDKLVRKAKHEARWMLNHLRPLEEIVRILAGAEVLLAKTTGTEEEEAMYIEIPWERRSKRQRRVRENWLFQRVLQSADDPRILGELERGELVALRDKLYEMKLFLERAQDVLGNAEVIQDEHQKKGKEQDRERLAEQITSTVTSDASTTESGRDGTMRLMTVRDALETFLYRKPAGFPQVESYQHGRELIRLITAVDYRKMNRRRRPRLIRKRIRGRLVSPPLHLLLSSKVVTADAQRPTSLEQQYHRRIRWFQLKTERKNDAERFLSVERESEEVQGMFRTLRAMKRPKLQPLNFIGSMRPINYSSGKRQGGQYRDGALLYEEVKENSQTKLRFIFLAVLHPHKGLEYTSDERHNQALRTKQHAWYKQRREENPLKYVAYPLTPAHVSKGLPHELFVLECGQQQEALLRRIIAEQETAQRQIAVSVNQGRRKSIPVAKCLPEHNPLSSARITVSWDDNDMPEFFLHQRVTIIPEKQPRPKRVVAFSPFEDRYSGAVLSFDGVVEWVGDIYIPKYLDPQQGAKPFSDNYIFWIANAMIAKGSAWEAGIGIEDTSWLKHQPSISREINRQIFSVPMGRVVAAVQHKARQEGFMKPRLIENVSPAYDCASCRQRLDKGEKTIVLEKAARCPQCGNVQMAQRDKSLQLCGDCDNTWASDILMLPKEQFFVCRRCQAPPRLARYNRAIVAAQKMLIDLVKHYDNALAKKSRDKQDGGIESS